MFNKMEKIFATKWGYACWTKSEFDIKNHVRLWTEWEPRNGKFHTKQEFLEEIVPNLAKNFTNFEVPLWEWVIIPNVQYDADPGEIVTVRVFRVHHSYMDAISMGIMLSECLLEFGQGSDTSRPPFIVDPKTKLRISDKIRLSYAKLRGLLLLPYFVVKALLAEVYSIQEDPYYPSKNAGVKRYGISSRIKVRNVKKIRKDFANAENATVSTTNVLASIAVFALEQVSD